MGIKQKAVGSEAHGKKTAPLEKSVNARRSQIHDRSRVIVLPRADYNTCSFFR